MNWHPIIDSSDISWRISTIAKALEEHYSKTEDIGLLTGRTGIALFFYYYSKFVDDDKYSQLANNIIDGIFEDINNSEVLHTYCNGLAGTGWTLEHLVQLGFIENDTDELLSDMDEFLQQVMINDTQNGYFDYLHGGIGYGLYFLNRSGDTHMSQSYLMQLVNELERLAQKDEMGGLKWLSLINSETRQMGFNLSLSHGISSIIAFLSKLNSKIDIDPTVHEQGKKKMLYLLNEAVEYLLNQTNDITISATYFPGWVCDQESSQYSRLAWCYGDLGTAIALWHASQSTKNKEWQKKSIDVLLHTAQRRDVIKESIRDAGMCHGASGLAHSFNRMHQYTGIGAFKEAAIYWFDHTLKMAHFDDGFAGYKAWHGKTGWHPLTGLLEGISGIGLALISSVSDIEPKWDESLLLS
jgi:class I lanthipeptide synthase